MADAWIARISRDPRTAIQHENLVTQESQVAALTCKARRRAGLMLSDHSGGFPKGLYQKVMCREIAISHWTTLITFLARELMFRSYVDSSLGAASDSITSRT
jgi:hypothetical protein